MEGAQPFISEDKAAPKHDPEDDGEGDLEPTMTDADMRRDRAKCRS
jgi:hypothetical protein